MNKLEKILGNQIYPNRRTGNILQEIANSEFNKNQLIECNSLFSTLVDCYNYGIIEGKRQERARHKKL
jgi:hypothetical protein